MTRSSPRYISEQRFDQVLYPYFPGGRIKKHDGSNEKRKRRAGSTRTLRSLKQEAAPGNIVTVRGANATHAIREINPEIANAGIPTLPAAEDSLP